MFKNVHARNLIERVREYARMHPYYTTFFAAVAVLLLCAVLSFPQNTRMPGGELNSTQPADVSASASDTLSAQPMATIRVESNRQRSVEDADVRAAFAWWMGYEPYEVRFNDWNSDGKWGTIPFRSMYLVGDGQTTRGRIGSIWVGEDDNVYGINFERNVVGRLSGTEFRTMWDHVSCEWTNSTNTQMIVVRLVGDAVLVVIPETEKEITVVKRDATGVRYGKTELVIAGRPSDECSGWIHPMYVNIDSILADDWRPLERVIPSARS